MLFYKRYALMRECWNEDWALRPTFTDIVNRMAGVLEEHCNPAVSFKLLLLLCCCFFVKNMK